MNSVEIQITRSRGVSLIEMMISLVIGLVLLAGIANIFSSNKNAYRYNEALGEIHDNGTFVMDYLTRNLVNAGYVPAPNKFIPADNNGDGVTDKADMEIWAYTNGLVPIVGTNTGAGAIQDAITLNSLTDPYDLNPVDCVGNPVSAPGDFSPSTSLANQLASSGLASFGITNQFTIANGASGRPALFCNGVEIIDGVENVRILYGEDTSSPPDGAVDIFSDADGVTDMRNVLVVRLGVIIASAKELRPAVDDKSYQLLDVTVSPKNDRRLRKVLTTTIKLRNRCPRLPNSNLCV